MEAAIELTAEELEGYTSGQIELRQLLDIDDHLWEQLKSRAQFFIDGGHHERALMMLDMLEELDRSNPLPGLLAVELLVEQGLSSAAERRLMDLVSRHGEIADVLVSQAALHLARGQMHQAAEVLKRVLEGDPDVTSAAGQRAAALARLAHERWQG